MFHWNFFWDLKSNLTLLLERCGPSTEQPHQTIRSLYNVTHLALSEGLEDLGNVGGEAHVDEHHLRELREGKRDQFVSGTK